MRWKVTPPVSLTYPLTSFYFSYSFYLSLSAKVLTPPLSPAGRAPREAPPPPGSPVAGKPIIPSPLGLDAPTRARGHGRRTPCHGRPSRSVSQRRVGLLLQRRSPPPCSLMWWWIECCRQQTNAKTSGSTESGAVALTCCWPGPTRWEASVRFDGRRTAERRR